MTNKLKAYEGAFWNDVHDSSTKLRKTHTEIV